MGLFTFCYLLLTPYPSYFVSKMLAFSTPYGYITISLYQLRVSTKAGQLQLQFNSISRINSSRVSLTGHCPDVESCVFFTPNTDRALVEIERPGPVWLEHARGRRPVYFPAFLKRMAVRQRGVVPAHVHQGFQ